MYTVDMAAFPLDIGWPEMSGPKHKTRPRGGLVVLDGRFRPVGRPKSSPGVVALLLATDGALTTEYLVDI